MDCLEFKDISCGCGTDTDIELTEQTIAFKKHQGFHSLLASQAQLIPPPHEVFWLGSSLVWPRTWLFRRDELKVDVHSIFDPNRAFFVGGNFRVDPITGRLTYEPDAGNAAAIPDIPATEILLHTDTAYRWKGGRPDGLATGSGSSLLSLEYTDELRRADAQKALDKFGFDSPQHQAIPPFSGTSERVALVNYDAEGNIIITPFPAGVIILHPTRRVHAFNISDTQKVSAAIFGGVHWIITAASNENYSCLGKSRLTFTGYYCEETYDILTDRKIKCESKFSDGIVLVGPPSGFQQYISIVPNCVCP